MNEREGSPDSAGSAARRVSVVVPVMNEEENVGFFCEEVRRLMDPMSVDFDMVFVDDGSTDSTLAKLLEIREADPRVRVVQLTRNFGSPNAINAGLSLATGDACIVISADFQDPPELCRDFVQRWTEGYDVVWGLRTDRQDPFLKSLFARCFYRILRMLAFPDFPKEGMDCGLFDRRVISEYLQFTDRDNIPFLTIFWMGFKQAFVPYVRRPRERGVSKWPFWQRVKSAVDVGISFSYFPIRMISALGLVVSCFSFLGAAAIFLNRLLFGIGGLGWPSLMVSVLFMGGLQLVVLGVLGEYLWRIAELARARPRFIVYRTHGLADPQARLPHPPR